MLIKILILTFIIEFTTIISRYFFGSMKTRYKNFKSKYKVRIHHGYIGLVLVLIHLIFTNNLLYIIGSALFLSDTIHHFIVLPIWVKKTEFP
jgi:hypothetical protein